MLLGFFIITWVELGTNPGFLLKSSLWLKPSIELWLLTLSLWDKEFIKSLLFTEAETITLLWFIDSIVSLALLWFWTVLDITLAFEWWNCLNRLYYLFNSLGLLWDGIALPCLFDLLLELDETPLFVFCLSFEVFLVLIYDDVAAFSVGPRVPLAVGCWLGFTLTWIVYFKACLV